MSSYSSNPERNAGDGRRDPLRRLADLFHLESKMARGVRSSCAPDPEYRASSLLSHFQEVLEAEFLMANVALNSTDLGSTSVCF